MINVGPGGTGKSMLIRAIVETFAYYKATERLALCATTGITASDIGGENAAFLGRFETIYEDEQLDGKI